MNRKIPINPSEPLIYDDTINDVQYLIKPCTGSTSFKFESIISRFGNGIEADKEQAIFDIVNLFLYGWESKDQSVKLPEFPKTGNPTDYLHADTIIDLFNEILKANGLTLEEKKSSSQQQTSYSEKISTEHCTTAMSASQENVNAVEQ